MSYTNLNIRNQPPSVTGRLTMKFTWMYTFHPDIHVFPWQPVLARRPYSFRKRVRQGCRKPHFVDWMSCRKLDDGAQQTDETALQAT